MEYKKLGKSDVLVSELILGCWAMGGDYFGATEDKSSLEALEVSYENGVNTFDTAEIYGDGRSERVVDVQLRTSEHRSMYSYVRLSIDRCTSYVRLSIDRVHYDV